jgi:hypothetical protein
LIRTKGFQDLLRRGLNPRDKTELKAGHSQLLSD